MRRKILLVDNDITYGDWKNIYSGGDCRELQKLRLLWLKHEMIKQEMHFATSVRTSVRGTVLVWNLLAGGITCNRDTPLSLLVLLHEKDDYEQEALQHGVTICMDKIKSKLLKDKLVEYATRSYGKNNRNLFISCYISIRIIAKRKFCGRLCCKGFNLLTGKFHRKWQSTGYLKIKK